MISVKRNGHVVVATLARPPVNALNGEIIVRLEAVVDEVTADQEIAMLHVRSDQKAFCAGADLALMHQCFSTLEGPDAMLAFVRRMQLLFQRIEMAPFMTLAEIGGAAVGGGMEMALACDLRIAANEAKLGLPEAQLGLLPGAGGTQRLARLCGIGVAKRLLLGGQVVDGSEAARLGMVQWACPREELRRQGARAGNPLCRDPSGNARRQQAVPRRRKRSDARRLRRRTHWHSRPL